MCDVVLISCPMNLSGKAAKLGDETSIPWMGLLYLASYLEKNKISVKIYDPGAEKLTQRAILNYLKKDRPKVIGLSALTSGIKSAVQIALAVKKEFKKEILIGIGGSHVNVDPGFINRYSCFDFSILGEGELVLTKVVKEILQGKKLKKKTFQGIPIDRLDEIPFPARHLINTKNYYPSEYHRANKKLSTGIVGSRGCPFSCNFCSRNKSWRKVRFRSGKNIVEEMEEIAKDSGSRFTFTDDAFTLNKKSIEEMCDEIIKNNHIFIWNAMTRADCIDENLIIKMEKAGCEELFFGVESGNSFIRNEIIGKNLPDESIKKAIYLCRKHGIRSSIFLMMGFPGETKKELKDTINFGIKFKPDFIGIHLTIPLPGSEVFEIGIKEKQYPKNIVDLYATGKLGDFMKHWPIFVPQGLSLEDLNKAKKKAYRKFYLSFFWVSIRLRAWLKNFREFDHDLGLIKIGVHTLIFGRTKNAAS